MASPASLPPRTSSRTTPTLRQVTNDLADVTLESGSSRSGRVDSAANSTASPRKPLPMSNTSPKGALTPEDRGKENPRLQSSPLRQSPSILDVNGNDVSEDIYHRSLSTEPVRQSSPLRQTQVRNVSGPRYTQGQAAEFARASTDFTEQERADGQDYYDEDDYEQPEPSPEPVAQLQYFHQTVEAPEQARRGRAHRPSRSQGQSLSSDGQSSQYLRPHTSNGPGTTLQRPSSAYTLGSELRGRTHSPHLSVGDIPSPGGSPVAHGRSLSAMRRSPDARPVSYVDLLNVPYSQQVAPAPQLENSMLRHVVGNNASLLDSMKTLEMYRANVKKTKDPAIQYEFAIFMVNTAQEHRVQNMMGEDGRPFSPPTYDKNEKTRQELLREAKQILQGLADRSYPFAQYYLADGYSSGLWNKGKPDEDRAFPLFVAASKHGHAEAAYRTGLCYEFGWGCRKDYAKAAQFYRASASKNHPGAATRLGKACLTGELGLGVRYREGIKWLKRAAESADFQYNSAPFELGLLHVTGYGDDIFKDEAYAAQLFTQSADLGHPEANLRMGEAYEHGLLSCPRDPALSVHFYNGAAQAGVPEAMMALCAWYMVGAEPVLDKDENEAYEWAKRAAECGLPKAEYAMGYFTEMGIGCRRDPLEANVWYVRAADKGEERAKHRLAIIRAAASGESEASIVGGRKGKKNGNGVVGGGGVSPDKEKECVVM